MLPFFSITEKHSANAKTIWRLHQLFQSETDEFVIKCLFAKNILFGTAVVRAIGGCGAARY